MEHSSGETTIEKILIKVLSRIDADGHNSYHQYQCDLNR